jgi:hypothetical protein
MIDAAWDPGVRRRVVAYLKRRAFVLPCIALGLSRCRLCGRVNGCGESSDGVFVWPSGLAHYVVDHGVRLPDDFVRHALTRPPAKASGKKSASKRSTRKSTSKKPT